MSYCQACNVHFDDIDAHNKLMHAGMQSDRIPSRIPLVNHPKFGPLVTVHVMDMEQVICDYIAEKAAQRVVELLTAASEGDVKGANRATRRKLRALPKLV